MVVVPNTVVVCEILRPIYWYFPKQPSLGFTETDQKKRKYPVSGIILCENVVDARVWRMARLLQADG